MGRLVARLTGHTTNINSAVFSSDGSLIVIASDDGTAIVWDANGHATTQLTGHGGPVNSAVFGPGNAFILTASGDNTAQIWRWKNNQLVEFEHIREL